MFATASWRRWPILALNLWEGADELEAKHGREGALRVIADQILKVDRGARRRLYLLHDEIARRAMAEPLSE